MNKEKLITHQGFIEGYKIWKITMTTFQKFERFRIKSTIKYLLQFIGVYILSLGFLVVMLEGIRIPDETVLGVAFFLTVAFYLTYGNGYQACKKSIANKIDKMLIDKGFSKETIHWLNQRTELEEDLIAEIVASNFINKNATKKETISE